MSYTQLLGGIYHLVHVVALVALASALIRLASSIALALSPSLRWHHWPHCASVAALVMLALLPLLHWCCCCLQRSLPCHLRLSKCQLNEGENACELTEKTQAQQRQGGLRNKGANASAPSATMPA
jgi:hypothetical protein